MFIVSSIIFIPISIIVFVIIVVKGLEELNGLEDDFLSASSFGFIDFLNLVLFLGIGKYSLLFTTVG